MAAPTERKQTLVDRAWDVQHRIEQRAKHVGKGKYGRVLKMARKPDAEEYAQTSKITLVGMMILGALGFVIYITMEWLFALMGI